MILKKKTRMEKITEIIVLVNATLLRWGLLSQFPPFFLIFSDYDNPHYLLKIAIIFEAATAEYERDSYIIIILQNQFNS